MKLKLFEINDDLQETEVALLECKSKNMKYYGWLLIIYFPKDGSKIYFRGWTSQMANISGDYPQIERVKTGLFSLDLALSNRHDVGFPMTTYELTGFGGIGKSTWASCTPD